MYDTCCGIDFGTTNSAISVINNDCPELINFHDKNTIPSAMFFPEGKITEPLFGNEAINQYINGEQGRFMRSLKRILGTDLMYLKTEVNGSCLSFEDIILRFIKYLKKTAENKTNRELKNVVLGRPVHFQDFAPEADKNAESLLRHIAINAGFKNVQFQYEPIAAAYAHEAKLNSEKLACVVDIGGGTSDFSIIRLNPKNSKKTDRKKDILANTGIRIGGNDFDRDLSIKCFMPELGYGTLLKPDEYTKQVLPVPSSPYVTLSEWSNINNLYTYREEKNITQIYKKAAVPEKVRGLYEIVKKEQGHVMLNQVEKTKIALSRKDMVETILSFLSYLPKIIINKKEFEKSIYKDVEKIIESLKECLQLAAIKDQAINLIVLTGGSSEIPYLKERIKSIFPAAELSEENKLASVAIGLSYDAARIYKND